MLLPNITELLVSFNRLTALPAVLHPNLREIRANDNQLQQLPENIGELSKLQVLCLNDNQLALPLPQGLLKCTALHTLWLSDNYTLPDELAVDLTEDINAVQLLLRELTSTSL